MNLQDVRKRFESRVTSIDQEMSDLQGKLALVRQAQTIAGEIGGASSSSEMNPPEPTESFVATTMSAVPAAEPVEEAKVEPFTAEPEEAVAPAASEAQPWDVAVAESEPEQAPEPAPWDVKVEEPVPAAASAVAAESAPEPEAEARAEPVADDSASDSTVEAEAEQVLAELEQEASVAETSKRETIPAEAVAADVAEMSDDPADDTAELEKLAEVAAQVTEDDPSSAKKDALASLREKLASAASEEPPKSPFLTLGKFLNRAK